MATNPSSGEKKRRNFFGRKRRVLVNKKPKVNIYEDQNQLDLEREPTDGEPDVKCEICRDYRPPPGLQLMCDCPGIHSLHCVGCNTNSIIKTRPLDQPLLYPGYDLPTSPPDRDRIPVPSLPPPPPPPPPPRAPIILGKKRDQARPEGMAGADMDKTIQQIKGGKFQLRKTIPQNLKPLPTEQQNQNWLESLHKNLKPRPKEQQSMRRQIENRNRFTNPDENEENEENID